MTQVRVLVAGMPRLLQDIVVGALGASLDLDPVPAPEARTPRAVRTAVARTGAAVAVVGFADADDAAAYDDVLYTHPRLRVLAVTGDGRAGFLYELLPRLTPLGDLSAAALVDAVRARPAAAHPGASPNP